MSIPNAQADTITLPDDVQKQEIQITQNNEMEKNTTSSLHISYTTGYLTRKERGIWYFESLNTSPNNIELHLPKNIQVVQSNPPASISQGEHLIFYWENATTPVEVSYVFANKRNAIQQQEQEKPLKPLSIILLVALGAAGITAFAMKSIHRKKQKQSIEPSIESQPMNETSTKPNITDGQMNVLRTANKNASHIISILLKHNGHLKRNTLESESGLAKSSLASTLNSLEKKGIISVDRSFHTHYIKLSDWFSSL
jgi:uncharacterized membrane protein